ncbi:MAG: DcrB-related protein [Spirochaetes bacterium]|nr:DcrB-related protein [Spirochaetota bacterium]
MRYSAILISVIVLNIVLLSGCARKEKGRYYNDEYGFSIVFPKYWEIQQKEMGAVVIALSPEEGSKDDFRENVAITVENMTDNVTLEQYFELSQKNLKNYSKDYKLLYKNTTWLAKKPAMILGFTYSMSGLKLKVLQYYCLNNSKAYVITCTALPHSFGRYEESFLKIVRSFRFEKK